MNAAPLHVLALAGSLRHDSANQRILRFIEKQLGPSVQFRYYEGLAQLPFFDPNVTEDNVPAAVAHFREAIGWANYVVVCTPEYIYSMPGMLKNALEWLVPTTLMQDKPTGAITAAAVGAKTHEALLLVLRTIGARISEAGAVHIAGVRAKLDAEGNITDAATRASIMRLAADITAG